MQFSFQNYADTFVDDITIVSSSQLSNLSVGEMGTLTCEITLNAPLGPDTSSLLVNWTVSNNRMLINDGRHQINLERKNDKAFHSVLTITNVTDTIGGEYTCTAAIKDSNNSKGESNIAKNDICVKGKSYFHCMMHNNSVLNFK